MLVRLFTSPIGALGTDITLESILVTVFKSQENVLQDLRGFQSLDRLFTRDPFFISERTSLAQNTIQMLPIT